MFSSVWLHESLWDFMKMEDGTTFLCYLFNKRLWWHTHPSPSFFCGMYEIKATFKLVMGFDIPIMMFDDKNVHRKWLQKQDYRFKDLKCYYIMEFTLILVVFHTFGQKMNLKMGNMFCCCFCFGMAEKVGVSKNISSWNPLNEGHTFQEIIKIGNG